MSGRTSVKNRSEEWASDLKDEICLQHERLLNRLDQQAEMLEDLSRDIRSIRARGFDNGTESCIRAQRISPDGLTDIRVSAAHTKNVGGTSLPLLRNSTTNGSSSFSVCEIRDGPRRTENIFPDGLKDARPSNAHAKDASGTADPTVSPGFTHAFTFNGSKSFSALEIKDVPRSALAATKERSTLASTKESGRENSTVSGSPGVSQQESEPMSPKSPKKGTSKVLDRTQRLTRLTKGSEFEIFFLVMIVLNAIWIGVETDHVSREDPGNLAIVTHLFSFVFFIELFLRLIAEKSDFLFGDGDVLWNVFDFLLVAGSIFEFAIFLISKASDQQTTDGIGNLQNLRLIRMFRLIRLMRLLRMARIVRFIRALRILVYSICTTLRSLIWAMFLLTGIMYFFAVMFTEATNEYLAETHRCSEPACAIDDDPWDMFGTIPRSMLTLYKSISNGIDWGLCTYTLGEISGLWVTTFVVYIAFSYFAVLNVVTGVFCQKAIESAQRDRELVISTLMENRQAHVGNIKSQFAKIFELSESDAGTVTLDEFMIHMDDDKVSGFFALLDIDASDAFALFKLLDDDGSGAIDADEFVEGCLRLQGTARSIDLAKVRHECKNMFKKIHTSNLSLGHRNREVLLQQGRQLDNLLKKLDEILARSSRGAEPVWTVAPGLETAHLKKKLVQV